MIERSEKREEINGIVEKGKYWEKAKKKWKEYLFINFYLMHVYGDEILKDGPTRLPKVKIWEQILLKGRKMMWIFGPILHLKSKIIHYTFPFS